MGKGISEGLFAARASPAAVSFAGLAQSLLTSVRFEARPSYRPRVPRACAPQIMAEEAGKTESVQTFGRKKTAVAVAYCKKGRGLMKINGVPIELVKPEILKLKVYEPILLLGSERFAGVDIRIRVKGGGYTSQIYGAQAATRSCGGWGAADGGL